MGRLVSGLSIRDFRKSDLHNVIEVASLSFAKEFEVTGFDLNHIEKLVNRIFGIPGRVFLTISRVLGVEPFKLLVAEVSDRVVGTTMISRDGRVAYISAVIVHPNYRRRGIARRLLESALEYIRAKKIRRAVLHVIPTNSPAKTLYAELGFKDFERIARLTMNTELILRPEDVGGVKIGCFRKSHANAVYHLIQVSEDPKHLEIFDFKKSDLQDTVLESVFRFSTRRRIVAVRDNHPIGYVEAVYTTPQEAGQIDNVQVCPEMKGRGIEEMLIYQGASEINRIGTKKIIGTASSGKPELITAMEKLGFKRCLELDGMFAEFE